MSQACRRISSDFAQTGSQTYADRNHPAVARNRLSTGYLMLVQKKGFEPGTHDFLS